MEKYLLTHESIDRMAPLSQIYLYLTEGCNLTGRHYWMASNYDTADNKNAVPSVATVQKKHYNKIVSIYNISLWKTTT